MVRKLLLLALFFALVVSAHAATFTAATCNFSDVNAVINGGIHTAVDGDVINIPSGTCTWTSNLVIPANIGITIIGAGTPSGGTTAPGAASSCSATEIIDNAGSSTFLILMSPQFSNSTTRISCMDIEPFSTSTTLFSPFAFVGTCTSSGCPNVRMDNITFGKVTPWTEAHNGAQAVQMTRASNMFGVYDHNTIPTGSDVGYSETNHASYLGVGSYGDNSWATADSFGTANNLFFENNIANSAGNAGQFVDNEAGTGGATTIGGTRVVVRFNQSFQTGAGTNTGLINFHGVDSGGRVRGGRSAEVYNNTISGTSGVANATSLIGLRSGTALVYGNTQSATVSFNNYIGPAVFRRFAAFPPWGGCGNGNYDSSITVAALGTATGGNGTTTLVDSSQSWATNQWFSSGSVYSLSDTTAGFVSEITSNTSNTITFDAGSPFQTNAVTSGDSYQIVRVAQCVDQPGRGAGVLLSATTPTPTGSVAEVLDPMYEWDDSLSSGSLNQGVVAASTNSIIANRDWYNEVENQTAQTSATSPFSGATGVGHGTLAFRPTTCTTGVAYAEYIGSTFVQLDKCTGTNTWTSAAYTAYTYPHPLTVTNHTWHIRLDGGNNVRCNGLANAPDPGSGTGVACAYNHPFQMLSFSGAWTALAAGDTIEFDDPPTNTTPYFMGEQNAGVGTDWNTQLGGICGPPNSPSTGCVHPQFPNNITIKGQHFGSCHNTFPGGLDHPTILSGINKVFYVLDVAGTNGMTISCVEVTQPDNCTDSGAGGAGACVSGTSNYIHGAGMFLNNGTSSQGPANMTLTDFAVVGTAGDGIEGSKLNLLSTDTFTASDVYVIGNGFNGWDGDSGGCGNSCESVGTMNITHLDAELNGCHVNLPYDWTKTPVANTFNYCYGQNTNGSGDNFVQLAAGTNFVLNMTHSLIKYGAQDGFDGAHISDDPTTNPATNVSTTWSEGNAGQQFKIGAGAASTLINDVGINTCEVLGTAANFPLNTSGWVVLDSGDLCRAGGGGMNLTSGAATTITVANNTTVGYGDVTWVFTCSPFVSNCNSSTILFKDNLSLAFALPSSGTFSAGGFLGTGITTANIPSPTHNLWFNMRTGCPDPVIGDTIAQCGDPLLVSESNVNAINPNLTSLSPAIANGIPVSGVTTDYNGVTRPILHPAIGAFEPSGVTPTKTNSINLHWTGNVNIP